MNDVNWLFGDLRKMFARIWWAPPIIAVLMMRGLAWISPNALSLDTLKTVAYFTIVFIGSLLVGMVVSVELYTLGRWLVRFPIFIWGLFRNLHMKP